MIMLLVIGPAVARWVAGTVDRIPANWSRFASAISRYRLS
jgi:hypothetical protein